MTPMRDMDWWLQTAHISGSKTPQHLICFALLRGIILGNGERTAIVEVTVRFGAAICVESYRSVLPPKQPTNQQANAQNKYSFHFLEKNLFYSEKPSNKLINV